MTVIVMCLYGTLCFINATMIKMYFIKLLYVQYPDPSVTFMYILWLSPCPDRSDRQTTSLPVADNWIDEDVWLWASFCHDIVMIVQKATWLDD